MSKKEHRLGVSEVNLVPRHLKMEAADSEQIAQAIDEIDHIYGLDAVSFDDKSSVLNLSYDASRTSIEGAEVILEKYGLSISHDWWTHFKESYYRFVDENIKENAHHKPLSCHQVPPGQRPRKKRTKE